MTSACRSHDDGRTSSAESLSNNCRLSGKFFNVFDENHGPLWKTRARRTPLAHVLGTHSDKNFVLEFGRRRPQRPARCRDRFDYESISSCITKAIDATLSTRGQVRHTSENCSQDFRHLSLLIGRTVVFEVENDRISTIDGLSTDNERCSRLVLRRCFEQIGRNPTNDRLE
jgi:hypothetical protein